MNFKKLLLILLSLTFLAFICCDSLIDTDEVRGELIDKNKTKPQETKPQGPGQEDPEPQDPDPQDPDPQDPDPQDPDPQDPDPQDPDPQDPDPQDPDPQDPDPQDPDPQDPDPQDPGLKRLRVNGNLIEYGAGKNYQTVYLRGVNVGDPYHFSKRGYTPVNYNTVRKNMNANIVRIAVHPNFWQDEKNNTLALLKQNVNSALAAGLFVIVDYHCIGYPDGYAQEVNKGEIIGYNSEFSLAENFWDTISKEITDGRVLYELWNEPASTNYGISETQRWLNLKTKWEGLIAIIRKNKSDNIIIAGGDNWAHELQAVRNNLITDSNTIYSWHMYAKEYKNSTTEWENLLNGLHTVRPVIVTEWGFAEESGDNEIFDPAPPNSNFAVPFAEQFLKGKNLHSTAWGYDPIYGPNMLSNWSSQKLNRFGEFVRDYLMSTEQIFTD